MKDHQQLPLSRLGFHDLVFFIVAGEERTTFIASHDSHDDT